MTTQRSLRGGKPVHNVSNGLALDGVAIGVLILRIAIGATFLAHGYNHIAPGKFGGTAKWFGGLGMRPARAQALLASVTELGAGALLIVGLLTPVAAGALAGTMAVAFVIAHRKNGFFIFRPGQGWEYVMNLFVACIAIGAMGAGRWSLDDAWGLADWKIASGLFGLWCALAIGVGGAALLLLVCWRPGNSTASAKP
ncbi:MAG: DoxX family protein [Acidimicrobiia bacterium]